MHEARRPSSVFDLTHLFSQSPPLSHDSPYVGSDTYQAILQGIARILHRPQSHVLLVGERGVGKRFLITEFARVAAAGKLRGLALSRILLVDCRFIAPDDSAQAIESVFQVYGSDPNNVICFTRFSCLLRNETGLGNKLLLLSKLSAAQCKIIGMLAPHEFDAIVLDDCDMRDFFTRVCVPEPDPAMAICLLNHFATGLQHQHALRIDPSAIAKAVTLTSTYILNQHQPSKSLAALKLACANVLYDQVADQADAGVVTGEDVDRAVAEMTGLPIETLRGATDYCDYEESLKASIVGQDDVVREVGAELGLVKAGLTDVNKPASILLFIGQTGTGKTETAKALAQLYSASKRLKVYPLGNFIEPHSVSGLIGVPPGYVGHQQGGRLINDLLSDPYGVFLLDEADKAHPDVLQPFLNLFDEGWIRDQKGVLAYGNKAIFVLTTNVGQRMIGDMYREGKSVDEITARMKEALSQIKHSKCDRPVFSPEFLARIKRIVVFRPLDRDAMEGICRKHIHKMTVSWAERREKQLLVSDELIQHIANLAAGANDRSHGREGGRIVHRLASDMIERPLQREMGLKPELYRRCNIVTVSLTETAAGVSSSVTFD